MNIYLSDEEIGDYVDSELRLEHQKDAKKLANAASAHTLKEVIEWGNSECDNNAHTETVTRLGIKMSSRPPHKIIRLDCRWCWDELASEYEALLEKGQTDVKED